MTTQVSISMWGIVLLYPRIWQSLVMRCQAFLLAHLRLAVAAVGMERYLRLSAAPIGAIVYTPSIHRTEGAACW